MREVLLALGLTAAASLVVYGVALLWVPVAFVVAGVLVALLSVVFFAEVV